MIFFRDSVKPSGKRLKSKKVVVLRITHRALPHLASLVSIALTTHQAEALILLNCTRMLSWDLEARVMAEVLDTGHTPVPVYATSVEAPLLSALQLSYIPVSVEVLVYQHKYEKRQVRDFARLNGIKRDKIHYYYDLTELGLTAIKRFREGC